MSGISSKAAGGLENKKKFNEGDYYDYHDDDLSIHDRQDEVISIEEIRQ
jgi:hypothetical protein